MGMRFDLLSMARSVHSGRASLFKTCESRKIRRISQINHHMTQRKIIAFYGPKGSGKSTCASILKQCKDFKIISFADPIREMLSVILPPSVIDRHSTFKELPRQELCGKSFRHAAQTLGTEWGRNLIDPDLWANHLANKIMNNPTVNFVVDDLRFQNEWRVLSDLGAKFIEISRDNRSSDTHSSEHGLEIITPDAIITNNGTHQDLIKKLSDVYEGTIHSRGNSAHYCSSL